jgi:hypothetical protein
MTGGTADAGTPSALLPVNWHPVSVIIASIDIEIVARILIYLPHLPNLLLLYISLNIKISRLYPTDATTDLFAIRHSPFKNSGFPRGI